MKRNIINFVEITDHYKRIGRIEALENSWITRQDIRHEIFELTRFKTDLEKLDVKFLFPPEQSKNSDIEIEEFLIQNALILFKMETSKKLQNYLLPEVGKIQERKIKYLLKNYKLCKKLNISLVLPELQKKGSDDSGPCCADLNVEIQTQNKKDDKVLDI